MEDNKKQLKGRLQFLHDMKGFVVAEGDPDIRGWRLADAENETIGTVDDLVVDTETEKVRYLDVDLDQSLVGPADEADLEKSPKGVHEFQTREGDVHMIVPIGVARLDMENKTVITEEIRKEAYERTRGYNPGTPITPDYEHHVFGSLIGRTGVSERGVGHNPLNTDRGSFYNSRYFNDTLFFGRRSNTIR